MNYLNVILHYVHVRMGKMNFISVVLLSGIQMLSNAEGFEMY